jgi:hypothetical protein
MAMSEASNTDTSAEENTAQKSGEGANAKIDGLAVRMLVRAIWVQEWMLANPEGTAEARKDAWKVARDAVMAKNLKLYRRAAKALTFSGVTISLNEDGLNEGDNA